MPYTHNGVTYYDEKFIHNNYEINYEVYKKDEKWYSVLQSYNEKIEDIIFSHSDRKHSEELLINWFKTAVDSNKVGDFISKDYKIEPCFEDVMFSVRDIPLGYHIASTLNRDKIAHMGLVPKGEKDLEVMKASEVIDIMKSKNIPDWVIRYNAVYSHVNMDNYRLMSKDYKCQDLYAVYLEPSRCWVGSQGLGGFCLFDEEATEEEEKEHVKAARRYGKLYWKFSCSLEEYIKNAPSVKKKDNFYGLDEILILHPLPPEKIKLIGHWDEHGVFHKMGAFNEFVKPEFLEGYRKILDAYTY